MYSLITTSLQSTAYNKILINIYDSKVAKKVINCHQQSTVGEGLIWKVMLIA